MPRRLQLALTALGLILISLALYQGWNAADDFRAFYRAAHLLQNHQSPYTNGGLTFDNHPIDFLPYLRIPLYAALLEPLTKLPYPTVRVLWTGLQILAAAALLFLHPAPRNLALALAFSLPLAFTLALGQDTALVLLATLGAAALYRRDRPFSAGFVAGLLALKVTYLPAVALVFLFKSRRGTLGLVASVAAQLGLSFVFAGPRWPVEYLAVLRNPLLDLEPRRMLSVRAVTTALGLPEPVYLVAAIAIFVFLALAARRLSLPAALTLALPLGLVASPHCYNYDGLVAVPLFLAALPVARVSILGLTPLPYLLLASGAPGLVFIGSAGFVALTLIAATQLAFRTLPENV